MENILIIGGSDAGISAALRIKEIDRQAQVSILIADSYPNFSICGLPFYLSGEVTDWKSLAHRTIGDIEKQGIELLLNHRATEIIPNKNLVKAVSAEGHLKQIGYDKLLIATGAESIQPKIEGLDSEGVFSLRWMADSFAIKSFMKQAKPQRAIIIGGGYIGLEMADALTRKKIEVTLVEYAPFVLTTLDMELAVLIKSELESKGIKVETGKAAQKIHRKAGELIVETTEGQKIMTDMVIIAVGAEPSTVLAQTAGIELGASNAISINRKMSTQVPNIWAAGDCVQTWHRVMNRYTYLPLGTTAHKQGRVAGENMLNGNCKFQGSLGTQVVKIFDKVAARTGLRDHEAEVCGFAPLTKTLTVWDHKAYYPGARQLNIRITGDKPTGQLLGAQIVGASESEVAKRIDIFATALFHSMKMKELCDLDLSYTPPISSPWDPVQMAAMHWCE